MEQIAIAEARGELEYAALLADSQDVSVVVSEGEGMLVSERLAAEMARDGCYCKESA